MRHSKDKNQHHKIEASTLLNTGDLSRPACRCMDLHWVCLTSCLVGSGFDWLLDAVAHMCRLFAHAHEQNVIHY